MSEYHQQSRQSPLRNTFEVNGKYLLNRMPTILAVKLIIKHVRISPTQPSVCIAYHVRSECHVPDTYGMVHICETFAAEYDIKFNEKKTVAILFGKGESPECHLKLNGQPVTWEREVKHLGNIVTSDLTDARDCARKRSFCIGSVNKLLGSYGKIQSNVLCKLFQIYCCSFYGSELWCCNSYGCNRCVQ